MSRNDIINTDGSIKWDTVGGFKDRLDGHDASLAENANDSLWRGLNIKVPLGTSLTPCMGDGTTNDTTNFQNMVNYCQQNNIKLVIPNGTFLIDSITFQAGKIAIEGVSLDFAILKANSAMSHLLYFDETNSDQHKADFKNFSIDGNGKANYGIYSTYIYHSLFERIQINNTLIGAMSIGNGWDNDIVECEISYNSGDGITFNTGNNNAINILNTKVFSNSGMGINVMGSINANIWGCDIESNKKGGIYAYNGCQALSIRGNHFEQNGQTGYAFTSPSAVTLNGDIILNGIDPSQPQTISSAYPCSGVVIEENAFSPYISNTVVIYLLSGNNVELKNNVLHTGTQALFHIDGDTSHYRTNNILINNNYNFGKDLELVDINNYKPMTLSTFKSVDVQKMNFAGTLSSSIATYGGGTIQTGDITFNGVATQMITGLTGNSDCFGFSINLDNYPWLQGKTVYFGAWTKQTNANMNARIVVSGAGQDATAFSDNTTGNHVNTQGYSGTTNWIFSEYQAKLGTTGTVSFGIGEIGSPTTGDKLYIAKPILAIVGANKELF